MRVLIAGCGYTGTALGLALAAEGHEVWGLRRSPAGLPAPIRPLAADLADPSGPPDLPDGLDAAVYAASADASEPEAYRRAYVDGVAGLARALGGGGGTRLVFVSSTAVYGERHGGLVDEDTPPDPDGFRGEILLEAEAAARAWDGTGSVVRASGIYGPGRDRLVRLARSGGFSGPGGPGDRWTNRIHRDDLAGAIRHVLLAERPAPVYLASDREPARLGDVLAWIRTALGLPPVGASAPLAPAATPARPGNLPGKRCAGRRLLEEGFAFRYPSWREGYRTLLHGHP